MEWLLLIVLVPAVVVPIIVLVGFAGCGATLYGPPEAPLMTSATPLDANSVELTWTYPTAAVSFEVQRRQGVNAPDPVIAVTAMPFIDSGLEGGTVYTYQVRARVTLTGELSFWSEEAVVTTWARAFTTNLAQIGTDRSADGACLVQRVPPGALSNGGNLVGITLRAAGNAHLFVSRVTISLPATQGNDFDSAAMPLNVPPANVTVTAGLAVPLQPVEFNVAGSDALLIAFDLGSPANTRVVSGVSATAYIKQGPPGTQITEAGAQNRAGFSTLPNELWLIDAIDVATKWPPIP